MIDIDEQQQRAHQATVTGSKLKAEFARKDPRPFPLAK